MVHRRNAKLATCPSLLAALFLFACGSVKTEAPDGGNGPPDATPPDADPCETATCECETDGDCGAHEVCDTSGPGRVCVCAPGYVGDPCSWGGAPEDPGFQNPDAWTSVNGALVNPSATGSIDTGEMDLVPSAVCTMGRISQVFTMPTYDRAEPFVAEVTYQTTSGMFSYVGAAVGFNRSWTNLPNVNNWQTTRICLGEGAYGGPVDFQASVDASPYDCASSPASTVAIDHFEVKVAAPHECPVPGEALNGNAEADYGWDFTSSGGSTAGFVAGAGNGGTRAARFNLNARCEGVSMTMRFSVPMADSMPSPALEFWWRGKSGVSFPMAVDNRSASTLVGTGAAETAHFCLPASTRGNVVNVRFTTSGGSGLCSDILNYDLSVDDVRLVSDPNCGTAGDLFDPGFESAPTPLLLGYKSSVKWQQVNALDDPTRAHSGSGLLQFVQQTFCNSSAYTNDLWVPESPSGTGPAIKFWSNVSTGVVTTAAYAGPYPFAGANVPTGGGWRLNTVCLPGTWANRWFPLRIGVNGGSGACDVDNGSVDNFYFDDFEIANDPACAP